MEADEHDSYISGNINIDIDKACNHYTTAAAAAIKHW